nr:Ig-like domain-containing protein [uncultured Celeribacter sp.]
MLGLNFSTRDSAGIVTTGTISENADVIDVRTVDDISLNLSTSDVVSYVRQGDNLVLHLADGQVVTLSGFFEGGDRELLLSEHGEMTRVEFADDDQGALYASYQDIDLSGKWSEYDRLAFLDLERVEPVVAPLVGAALLGGSGLGAAATAAAGAAVVGAAVINTGDDDESGRDSSAPDVTVSSGVENTGDYVNGDSYDSGSFGFAGEGEPGATVEVTVNDTTHTTTVDEDGTWSVDFDSDTIDGGEYTTEVSVTTTDEAGNSSTVIETLVVDTEAEDLSFDTVEGDDVINIVEASDDVFVSGQSEAGATVVVELEGQTVETVVDENGTWSVTFAGSELPGGTYESTVTATVTDAYGNAATYTHDVTIDLETSVALDGNTGGADGTVNLTEMTDGVAVSGTGEAGATVVVTVAGVSQTTTVSEDGSWSASYANGSLPEGVYTADVSVEATDLAGNTATASGSFEVDTTTTVAIDGGHSGGDETVNEVESQSALSFSGTAEAGASVAVTLAGVTQTVVADGDGVWSVTYAAGTVASGEYDTELTAVSTDAAGNTSTATSTVHVDTVAGDIALSSDPIEGDNVINAVEASDGVWITGTATPGHTVEVTLGGASHTVTSTPEGTFAAFFEATEVTAGEYDTTATATISDDAGNSKTVQTAVEVDTLVSNFAETGVQGGADGVVNAAETAEGVILSGTVEIGSTVTVSYGGAVYAATVASDGSWSAEIPASALPAGEGTADVIINATDPAGNTASLVETVTYDTLVNDLSIEADTALNLSEVAAGTTFTGTVEAGSAVQVTLNGVTQAATVAADGSWSVTYDADQIELGTYTTDLVVTATDAAGNTLSETTTIAVDTEADTPNIEAITRDASGIRAVTIAETDEDVSVFSLSDDGTATEVGHTAIDLGDDTYLNFSQNVSNGDQIVVVGEDDAGNDSASLLVLDTTTNRPDGEYFAVDTDNAGLDGFEIDTINLEFVNGGEVTLTAADLDRLAGDDNTLTITGDTDDRVVLDGGSLTDTTTIDGTSYDIYTLGDDQVLIDHNIEVVLP